MNNAQQNKAYEGLVIIIEDELGNFNSINDSLSLIAEKSKNLKSYSVCKECSNGKSTY